MLGRGGGEEGGSGYGAVMVPVVDGVWEEGGLGGLGVVTYQCCRQHCVMVGK